MSSSFDPPPGAWPPAYAVKRRLLSPIQRLLEVEAASGWVLLAATVIALGWANSPWAGAYRALWGTELAVGLGPWRFAEPLAFWVNDGAMTIFFFVAGLEIRRELHDGALSTRRRAALPVVAAVGGMLAPAAIYAALNTGRAGGAGWGVPMATDIAFAIGALALLGSRVSAALRVWLLALAVIDDIGAILVIAIFYSAELHAEGAAIAAAGLAAVIAMQLFGVRHAVAYVVPGVVVWAGLLVTGIHPTLAGVILGLCTPVRAADDEGGPAARLHDALHPWVAFAIMPVFALANAGIALGRASLAGDAGLVFFGIALGLVVGKPLGILLASRLAVRARIAAPAPAGGLVVGVVAGIGFTMSMFIAQLALPAGPLLDTAKLAILVGSLISAGLGLALGRRQLARPATMA
ncbi:MAG TPA: Na+/H+ antiporter NhaA [Kofleriaceae bacterium]|nr:Na+/H+ antiporter NhaA [Kofleriaceae bacterium]